MLKYTYVVPFSFNKQLLAKRAKPPQLINPFPLLQCDYNLQFETVASFAELDRAKCSTLKDVITVVAQAGEFGNMVLRRGEKQWLNEFGWKQARFPNNRSQRVQTGSEKVVLLIQAGIGRA